MLLEVHTQRGSVLKEPSSVVCIAKEILSFFPPHTHTYADTHGHRGKGKGEKVRGRGEVGKRREEERNVSFLTFLN